MKKKRLIYFEIEVYSASLDAAGIKPKREHFVKSYVFINPDEVEYIRPFYSDYNNMPEIPGETTIGLKSGDTFAVMDPLPVVAMKLGYELIRK